MYENFQHSLVINRCPFRTSPRQKPASQKYRYRLYNSDADKQSSLEQNRMTAPLLHKRAPKRMPVIKANAVLPPTINKIFWSETHSKRLTECGVFFPSAPPTTPTPAVLKRNEYIPSLHDVKAQRSLHKKLKAIETRIDHAEILLKKRAERHRLTELAEYEKRKWARQRQEIYALNKIMAAFEEMSSQQHGVGGV